MLAGREEVQADHVLRPRDAGGDGVDVQVRSVGGDHGAGLQTRSSSANTAFFTSMSSNTASMTRSTFARSAYGAPGSGTGPGPCLRAHAALGHQAVVDLRHVGAAARDGASSRSTMVTGRPASSTATAMPAPMVPPPTTPTEAIGAAARCASPAPWPLRARRRRRGSGRHVAGCRCTAGRAGARCAGLPRRAGPGPPRRLRRSSAARTGRGSCFAVSALMSLSVARALRCRPGRGRGCGARRRRRQLLGVGQAGRLRAGAVADAIEQAGLQASLAPRWRPLSISRGRPRPMSAGARCVPPEPGIRPSCTSGRPSLASAIARR